MRGWGLDYEQLRELQPRVVMVSTLPVRPDGPLSPFAGYGNLGAALAGFFGLAGWPDRPPCGPFGAYTDYTSTHLVLARAAGRARPPAPDGRGPVRRLRPGRGGACTSCRRRCSTTRSTVGVDARAGNADPDMAPHGVYPAAGDDRWVAVACQDDAAWPALCRVLGRDDLAADRELAGRRGPARPAGRAGRRRRGLDVAARTRPTAEALLIEAGVAAHAVQQQRASAWPTRSCATAATSGSCPTPSAAAWSRTPASALSGRRSRSACPRGAASTPTRCSATCSATRPIASPPSARPAPSADLIVAGGCAPVPCAVRLPGGRRPASPCSAIAGCRLGAVRAGRHRRAHRRDGHRPARRADPPRPAACCWAPSSPRTPTGPGSPGSSSTSAIGLGFALGYAASFALLDEATWWLGGLFGLLHVAVALTVLVPLLAGVHPAHRVRPGRAGVDRRAGAARPARPQLRTPDPGRRHRRPPRLRHRPRRAARRRTEMGDRSLTPDRRR